MKLEFRESIEGLRAWAGDRVIAIIHAPKIDGADYWCQVVATGAVYKNLSLPEARQVAAGCQVRPRTEGRATRMAARAPLGQVSPSTGQPVGATQTPHAPVKHNLKSTVHSRRAAVRTPAAAKPAQHLKPCRICGVPVRKEAKHMRKVHGTAMSPAGSSPARSAPKKGLQGGPVASASTRVPVAARRAVLLTKALPAKLTLPVHRRGSLEEVQCPACGLHSAPDRIWEQLSRLHPRINFDDWKLGSVSVVREKPAMGGKKRNPKKPSGKKVLRRKPGTGPTKFREFRPSGPAMIERSHDASRPFAHRFRERGRFGSAASYDGYGDDDRP